MTGYAAAAPIDSSEKEFFQNNVEAVLNKKFADVLKIPAVLDDLDEEIDDIDEDINTWKKWLPSISGVLFSILSIVTFCIRNSVNSNMRIVNSDMRTVNENTRSLKDRVRNIEKIMKLELAGTVPTFTHQIVV